MTKAEMYERIEELELEIERLEEEIAEADKYKILDKAQREVVYLTIGLIKAFKEAWYKENKPHGFDVQELRLGGLLLRLKSCKERLKDYIEGKVSIIDELEEEVLDCDGKSNSNHRKIAECFNVYNLNATANNL